jgi:hypothetical protein
LQNYFPRLDGAAALVLETIGETMQSPPLCHFTLRRCDKVRMTSKIYTRSWENELRRCADLERLGRVASVIMIAPCFGARSSDAKPKRLVSRLNSDVARKHRTSHELQVAVNYTKSYRGQWTVLE